MQIQSNGDRSRFKRFRLKVALNFVGGAGTKKVGSKSYGTVDFVSRFIFLINSKFKIHTFNNYYESQCKINNSSDFELIFCFKTLCTSPPPTLFTFLPRNRTNDLVFSKASHILESVPGILTNYLLSCRLFFFFMFWNAKENKYNIMLTNQLFKNRRLSERWSFNCCLYILRRFHCILWVDYVMGT
jgi:hypothetical protein